MRNAIGMEAEGNGGTAGVTCVQIFASLNHEEQFIYPKFGRRVRVHHLSRIFENLRHLGEIQHVLIQFKEKITFHLNGVIV